MEEQELSNDDVNEEPFETRKTLTTFPFKKSASACNCGKYNLQEIPQLRKILPSNYDYKLCDYIALNGEDQFLATLRMSLISKEEALEWKRQFEEKSLTTHVLDKSFPKVGRVSVFKVQYRCQFFDRRKAKNKLQAPEKSKFRDCHSILFINIKKFFKNTVDQHMPKYCTVVRLHYAHSHPLDTADVLRKRGLSSDIQQRFLEMYEHGTKPKDALDTHKRELLQKLGPEKYRQVVCDGYYVPNLAKVYRLYYQFHGKGVSAKTSTKRASRHNPSADWLAFQAFSPTAPDLDEEKGEENSEGDDNNDVNFRGGDNQGSEGGFGDTLEDGDLKDNGTDNVMRAQGLLTCIISDRLDDASRDLTANIDPNARGPSLNSPETQYLMGTSSVSQVLESPILNPELSISSTSETDPCVPQKPAELPGRYDGDGKKQDLVFERASTSAIFSNTHCRSSHVLRQGNFPCTEQVDHSTQMKVQLPNLVAEHRLLSSHPPGHTDICSVDSGTRSLPGSVLFTPSPSLSWGTFTSQSHSTSNILPKPSIMAATVASSVSDNYHSRPVQTPRPLHGTPQCKQISHLQQNIPAQNVTPLLSSQHSLNGIYQNPYESNTLNKMNNIFYPNEHPCLSGFDAYHHTTSVPTTSVLLSSVSNIVSSPQSHSTMNSVNSNECYYHSSHHTVHTSLEKALDCTDCDTGGIKATSTLSAQLPPAEAQAAHSSLHCIPSNTVTTPRPSEPISTASISKTLSAPTDRATTQINSSKTRKTLRKQKSKLKSKPPKDLNIKLITKRWMEQKPKVDAETQNLASELMETILLRDRAEKLKVRLHSFLSGVESKMASNLKLFVPAVDKFLQAGESAKDDSEITTLLKDFGKTEESLFHEWLNRSEEVRRTRATQTHFSRCARRVKINFVVGTKAGTRR